MSKPFSNRAQEQAAGSPIQHSIEYLNILLRLLVSKPADLSVRVLLESLNFKLFGLILYSTLNKFTYLYYLNICYLNDFLLVGTKGKINLIHKVTKSDLISTSKDLCINDIKYNAMAPMGTKCELVENNGISHFILLKEVVMHYSFENFETSDISYIKWVGTGEL